MSPRSDATEPAGTEPAGTGRQLANARRTQVRRADPLAAGVPDLGPSPRLKLPRVAERHLASGLRVVAARLPGVPLTEVRLWIPFAGTAPTHAARAELLAATLLTGTATRSRVGLAEELQAVGAELAAHVDADRLLLSGSVLSAGLPVLFDVLADVLGGAAFPPPEVDGERARLVERLAVARAQPSVLVREALRRRLFGSHPYARELPRPEAVGAVTPAVLHQLHGRLVAPGGAVLVLVGDRPPARMIALATQALGGWSAAAPIDAAPPPLPPLKLGPTVVVDRPGSVQSSLRVAAPAPRRDDADYPALQLANLVYGGYFSSRLTENIRERRGYTYNPISLVDHDVAGSTVVTSADVATEVTAPALVEVGYELGRVATTPPTDAELDAVRRYALGILVLGMATQAGLASTLARLLGAGLAPDWPIRHAGRLAAVTAADVAAAARRYLAPSAAVTVVLGDAAAIAPGLAALGPVDVWPAAGGVPERAAGGPPTRPAPRRGRGATRRRRTAG